MSTVLVNITKDKIPALRKFIVQSKATMRIIKDEEDIMQKLVEEGLKTKTESIAILKKQLLKSETSY